MLELNGKQKGIMAENSKLTSIELNGKRYSLGESVYEELGISLERFAELLGRDLYCPTLNAAPTSSTLTYTDTDDSVNSFQVGQPCRWQEEGEWRLAFMVGNANNQAEWLVIPTKEKQDKNMYFTNVSAGNWVADTVYEGFAYRCDLPCTGVTSNDHAQVVFAFSESSSGDYAQICETKSNVVRIWGKTNKTITIPTIIILK